MALYLGILIFSFVVSSVLMVPFINLLYRLRLTRRNESVSVEKGDTVEFKKLHDLHSKKIGTPIGGGILVIIVVSLLYFVLFPIMRRMGVYITAFFPIQDELHVIFFTFISFGILGLYDDVMKIFGFEKTGFFGLRMKHKLIIQVYLSVVSALLLYFNLGVNFVNIPFFGVVNLGLLYIPFASFVIISFTNAFDITDGLDGLSCGVLMVCLLAFWILSMANLDTTLSTFIALWIGSLLAFLYFNVHPARIWLGNAGGLAFGATLAVIGLLIGKIVALVIIGGIFVVEASSSLIQILAFRFFKKRIFPIAPVHHWLQIIGWPETKIVMRAWLVAIVLALFGTWLAQL